MAKIKVNDNLMVKEHLGFAHYPLISWRSIVAGLIFSVICYVALTALGVGVMGTAAQQLIQESEGGGQGIAIGAAIWAIVSILLSLVVGSYFAARISNLVTGKMGGAQGLVIASVFFALIFWGAGNAIGALGGAMGSAAKSIGGGAQNMMQNPAVQNQIDQAFQGLNLKSPPEVVAQNLASRIIAGDQQGAKNYLAYQAGIPASEVDVRIAQLQTQLQNAAESTAQGVAIAGWILFAALVLGLGSGYLGGRFGAVANIREPLVDEVESASFTPRPVLS